MKWKNHQKCLNYEITEMLFSYETLCAQAMHYEAYYRVRNLARCRQP